MKGFMTKIFLFFLSVSLVACSSNTQNENTGIGAVTGGLLGGLAGSAIGQGTGKVVAIGAGVIAGALLGGYIGHNMDSVDNAKMTTCMQNNPTNKSSHWKNKKTNISYTVTPTTNVMSYNGHADCRRFVTTISANGKDQEVRGVACRQPDGHWRDVSAG